MKFIAIIFLWLFTMNREEIIIELNSPEIIQKLMIVNDGVMGGISKGRIELSEQGNIKFLGKLSPKNNGGFTSFRLLLENQVYADCNGVRLHAKGDGKIYKITLRTDENFDGLSYQAEFKTNYGKWENYIIDFSEFLPKYRGRIVEGELTLFPQNIKQVGILIADKQFGEFEIELDKIKIY